MNTEKSKKGLDTNVTNVTNITNKKTSLIRDIRVKNFLGVVEETNG